MEFSVGLLSLDNVNGHKEEKDMMKVTHTMMFVTKGWFCYGQGDDEVGCFADAMGNAENLSKEYPNCFDINDAIDSREIVDTEKYCVCYDADDYGQKAFSGNGLKIKEKLLYLYTKGRAEASWIFPMSKAIKTKLLEKVIRDNPNSYKKVADWIGEEW